MASTETAPANTAESQLVRAVGIARRPRSGAHWLLDHVSLELAAGECLVVAGPTGSGKTLLLRALARLDPLDSGDVLWRGAQVAATELPRYRARVMYLHQRSALEPGDVEQNLRRPFALASHRAREFDPLRAAAWFDALGRGASLLTRQTADLSGGERQLVSLVRALLLDPQVLLLDEPTAALDPQAARAAERVVGDWLREASHERAAVWVSHSDEQQARMATRTVRMEAGRLVDSRGSRERAGPGR